MKNGTRMLAGWIGSALLASSVATRVGAQEMTLPDQPPGRPDPKIASKGRYRVDPSHSQVLFTVAHLGYTDYTGMFTNPTGTLDLDPSNLSTSHVEVTFPVAGVKTTVAELDAQIASPMFFDAAIYPTATFRSTKVVASGTNLTIHGDLSMHGVTKPVVLTGRFIGAGAEFWGNRKMAIGFAATTTIRRSDFGMGVRPFLVSDRVDLTINAGFEAQ